MNLTIIPGAATEDASQIDAIVEQIDKCMLELDSVIKRVIPDGVETDWSNKLRADWNTYYENSVKFAMEEMKLSAKNLRVAVDAALQYDK